MVKMARPTFWSEFSQRVQQDKIQTPSALEKSPYALLDEILRETQPIPFEVIAPGLCHSYDIDDI